MTDYNQELYWREYQHRVAMAAAAAAVAGSNQDPLQAAKTEFVKNAFKEGVTPDEKKEAVKTLLKTANGEKISLADSNSAPGATVSAQFEVIVTNLSAVSEDGPVTANIVLPANAGISATTSYLVPKDVTLVLGVYEPSQTPRSSEAVTISGSDHLFKAEGGSIVINNGFYKVTGSNKYVIRSGYNPTDKDLKTEEDKISKAKTLTGDVVINGGTFESEDSYVMTIWYDSSITINNGTFKSSSAIFSGNGNAWCANANLIIKGGTFEVANETVDSDGYISVIGYWPVGYGMLTVNGGTFTINTPNRPASIFAVRAGSGVIKGGTYSITACNTSEFGKVGDAQTKLPAGMFTVTSNANYVGEPTATIDVDTSSKPANVADIVVLDSVGDTPDFDALLSGTDQSKYSYIKKYTLKDGKVIEYTGEQTETPQPETSVEETTQA